MDAISKDAIATRVEDIIADQDERMMGSMCPYLRTIKESSNLNLENEHIKDTYCSG